MFVIAGLGNPGKQYDRSRHNIGFETIDYLSAIYRIPLAEAEFKALIGKGFIQGKKVILVKPQTYMNNSGLALRELIDYYKLQSQQLIVIYDDIDLDTGVIRIRLNGGAGTHNGMRSILYHLGTEDFPRIRIGIGKPDSNQDLAGYVLGRLNPEEQRVVNKAIEKVADAIAEIMVAGIPSAMSRYNG